MSRGGAGLSGLVAIGMVAVVLIAAAGTVSFFRGMRNRGGKPPATMRGGGAGGNTVDRSLYEHLQEENKSLQKQIVEIQKSRVTEAHVSNTEDKKEKDKLEKSVKRLTDYKQRMHQNIQSISKRQLLNKYGPGPHYVEILVSFDPASNLADFTKPRGNDTDVILIQMAPVDEMPATVFHFLEQVNEKLYDGASFHRNAGHVVQGGPAPNFESVAAGGGNPMKRFKETGLAGVPFQE